MFAPAMCLASVLLFLLSLFQSAAAISPVLSPEPSPEVYKVGDAVGWTILGNPDYKAWAARKAFHVGDVLEFNYDEKFHDVVEVTREGFRSCSAALPLSTWTTGHDTITLNHHGHRYFICSFPGHCIAGQKLDVRVTGNAAAAGSTEPPTSSSSPRGDASTVGAPSIHVNASAAAAGTAGTAVIVVSLAATAALMFQ